MSLRITTKVKIQKNEKTWNMMKRNLSRGGKSAVNVGWFYDKYPDGKTIAQVAAWNEEGHLNGNGTLTPPRPFIRLHFMKRIRSKGSLDSYIQEVHLIAMGKSTWYKLNKRLSEELIERLQLAIIEWKTPPNSPYTIKLKGFNDPLIDTGRMFDKVKAKIVRKG